MTNEKAEIEMQSPTLDEILHLFTSLGEFFSADSNKTLNFYLPLGNVICDYMKIATFYKGLFTGDIPDFNDFFMDYCEDKYSTYISKISQTPTSRIIDDAFSIMREMFIKKATNPLTETLAKVNVLLDKYAAQLENVDSETLKKFITDFAEFTQKTDVESITNIILEKAVSENREMKSSNN